MSSTARADVAVIGLGAMGCAALYQLAKRGAKAIGIDRYAPPHTQGSSHGETRITRQAVGEGQAYVPLVLNSHRIWRELEAETNEPLFVDCGVLIIGSAASTTVHHGKPDFIRSTIGAAREFGIPHEVLSADDVSRRFPQFLGLDGREQAYYEPGGGYVFPERCIAAQLRRAAELGAAVRTNTRVLALTQERGGVAVTTNEGSILADRVIVSAGAWTAPLLGFPFDRLLTVKRQVLHWFALDDVSPYGDQAPVFIWMHGERDTDYFYGFPPLQGEARIKVATEQYATSTSAQAADRSVSPAESAEMFRVHVEGRLAGVSPRAVQAAACLYTVTPDSGFIIDTHPALDRVVVVSACSGHGFKQSAGIGSAVAELVCHGRSSVDLSAFSLARFGPMSS